jgi:hypothetical protein
VLSESRMTARDWERAGFADAASAAGSPLGRSLGQLIASIQFFGEHRCYSAVLLRKAV